MRPSAPPTVRGRDVVTRYYLATPLFAVADFVFGVPVRISLLDAPLHRGAYYAILFACGLLCRAYPMAAPWVGIVESGGNILLLILAVMLPVYALPDAVWSGAELVSPFSKISIANFVLAGTALVVSFHRHQRVALYGYGRPRASSLERSP